MKKQKSQSGFAHLLIIATILCLGLIGTLGFLYYQNYISKKDEQTTKTPASIKNKKDDITPKDVNPELTFAEKLESCEPYKMTFKHPFTGDTLEKEIVGIVNNKCAYIEQMPNNGEMECKYTETERKTVAQYYIDYYSTDSDSTSTKTNNSEETMKTYTFDGKVSDNPIQVAMDNSVCVVSGY